MTAKLIGKIAVVTGASKGIGAAIAKALALEGAKVIVNYATSQSDAQRVVDEIQGRGGQAVAIQADLAKSDAIEPFIDAAAAAFQRIDILVNNAGIYLPSPLGEITVEHIHRQFNLNVLGLILATQAVVTRMPQGGVIVNTSSAVSQHVCVGCTSISKGWISTFNGAHAN